MLKLCGLSPFDSGFAMINNHPSVYMLRLELFPLGNNGTDQRHFYCVSVVTKGQQGLDSEIVAHFAFDGCTVLLSSAVNLPVVKPTWNERDF